MRASGRRTCLFHAGQVSLESKAYWENVPDGQLCLRAAHRRAGNLFNEKGKAFAEKYKAATGKDAVESYAMEAYDSIAIIAQAINEAGSTDGDAIVGRSRTSSHDGTLGKIYFPYGTQKDPSADGKGDEWWHQWPDPALTVIQYQEGRPELGRRRRSSGRTPTRPANRSTSRQ